MTSALIIFIFLATLLIHTGGDKLKLNKEVREVFQLHKYYRNSIRFCQIPRQPPAKFLSKLVWNKELAKKAQITANRCNYAYDSPSDMKFDEFISVAQNIADSPSIQKAVASWFSEYRNYTYETDKCKGTCMQYKQMVRGEETEIGCGVKKCKKNYVVVCNYSPAADENRQPYEKGSNKNCDNVDDAEY
uniref:SCP domain-containing protein n=1 Tax=Trichobilharzia regenti TaxID=157069 RepID=A0AA85IVU0_TRIRE|nr:unnamed protein product [Trichobilharzia regenti]